MEETMTDYSNLKIDLIISLHRDTHVVKRRKKKNEFVFQI